MVSGRRTLDDAHPSARSVRDHDRTRQVGTPHDRARNEDDWGRADEVVKSRLQNQGSAGNGYEVTAVEQQDLVRRGCEGATTQVAEWGDDGARERRHRAGGEAGPRNHKVIEREARHHYWTGREA